MPHTSVAPLSCYICVVLLIKKKEMYCSTQRGCVRNKSDHISVFVCKRGSVYISYDCTHNCKYEYFGPSYSLSICSSWPKILQQERRLVSCKLHIFRKLFCKGCSLSQRKGTWSIYIFKYGCKMAYNLCTCKSVSLLLHESCCWCCAHHKSSSPHMRAAGWNSHHCGVTSHKLTFVGLYSHILKLYTLQPNIRETYQGVTLQNYWAVVNLVIAWWLFPCHEAFILRVGHMLWLWVKVTGDALCQHFMHFSGQLAYRCGLKPGIALFGHDDQAESRR